MYKRRIRAKWEGIYDIVKIPALVGLLILLIITGRADWLALL